MWERVAGARKGGKQALGEIVAGYLSREHRDAPGSGCVVAALGPDIARQSHAVREAFTSETSQALDYLADQVAGENPAHRRENAIAAFACMVGGLIMARAVSDKSLSELILKTSTRGVIELASRRRPGVKRR